MPNNFKIETFEPVRLRKAQESLDKHFLAVREHEHTNEVYKQSVFKETMWEKFLGFFKANKA